MVELTERQEDLLVAILEGIEVRLETEPRRGTTVYAPKEVSYGDVLNLINVDLVTSGGAVGILTLTGAGQQRAKALQAGRAAKAGRREIGSR
jgi:hypothetical protein